MSFLLFIRILRVLHFARCPDANRTVLWVQTGLDAFRHRAKSVQTSLDLHSPKPAAFPVPHAPFPLPLPPSPAIALSPRIKHHVAIKSALKMPINPCLK